MPINDIETVLLGQSFPEVFPILTSIIRSANAESAFDGCADHVAICGRYPCLVRVVIGNGDGESKTGGSFGLAHLLPADSAIGGTENSTMILLPEDIGIGGGSHKNMGIMSNVRGGVREKVGP